MHNKIYITVMSVVFIAATIILTTFPRPKYSEVEKRDLAQFPEWSVSKLAQGTWTSEVSSWFSDSEPYRERLMTLSMKIKDLERLVLSDDNVTFHAADDMMEEGGGGRRGTGQILQQCVDRGEGQDGPCRHHHRG